MTIEREEHIKRLAEALVAAEQLPLDSTIANAQKASSDISPMLLARFSKVVEFQPLSEKTVGILIERMRARGDAEQDIQNLVTRNEEWKKRLAEPKTQSPDNTDNMWLFTGDMQHHRHI